MNIIDWFTKRWCAKNAKRKPAHVRRLEKLHSKQIELLNASHETELKALQDKLDVATRERDSLKRVAEDLNTQIRSNEAENEILNTQIESLAKVIARDQKRVEAETAIAAKQIGSVRAQMEN